MQDNPPKWFYAWVRNHLQAFDIFTDQNFQHFSGWWRGYDHHGYTLAEMNAATRLLLNGKVIPKSLADHYHGILEAIAANRNKEHKDRERAATENGIGRPTCEECFGTGHVIVPHKRFCGHDYWNPQRYNVHGYGIFITMAVYCRCDYGHKCLTDNETKKENGVVKHAGLSIGEYEMRYNRNWQKQIEQRSTERKMEMGLGEAMKAPEMTRPIKSTKI